MIDAVLAQGRAARLELMRDTIRIGRPSGPPVFDPGTGEYTPAAATALYEGPADVKPRPVTSGDVQSGERATVTFDYDVAIPWTSVLDLKPDDLVTVLTSGDPSFAGNTLVVTAVEFGARRTAHHFSAQDQS